MGARSGIALKFLQWAVRGVQFLCAALTLGVYSYFLAALASNDLPTPREVKAVEGISGVAVIYTIIGLLLLCCCAGLTLASFIAIVLDVAFIGAFIYVAVANRNGAGSCTGYLDTPFGEGFARDTADGDGGVFNSLPSYRTACRLQSAVLAVSIVIIVFFVLSIGIEIFLARHHRKEKRFGPGPMNNYTSGYGSPGSGNLFTRMFRRDKGADVPKDENALPEHTHPDQVVDGRESYATETTAVHPEHHAQTSPYNKYDNQNTQGVDYGYAHGYGNPSANNYDIGQQQQGYTIGTYRYDDGVYERA